MREEYKRIPPASRRRPHDADERYRVRIVTPVLPGDWGTGYPVWTEADDPDVIATFDLPIDPAADPPNPDRSFQIYDINNCNCLLPEELAWIRYDEDSGLWVPEGSQGLYRTAVAKDYYDQDSQSMNGLETFYITKHGKLWEYEDPESLAEPIDTLNVEIEVVASQSSGIRGTGAPIDELWIYWNPGDEEPVTEPAEYIYRPGRWRIITKKGLAFAQAPAAGIPARVGALPGAVDCEVIVQAPSLAAELPANADYGVNEFILLHDEVEVQNWDKKIVADEGDGLIQIEGHWDGAFIVGFICANQGARTDFAYHDDTV